eukprot:CAMPEP_0167802220 /NCGR_PEP_ID=MMETSP0111_2-20121227/18986_1 /TAXON_ID=91324 /ORGANISM="Lotharella globosa, Strain CCCM811" /LENGTH=36 /DNA_ID= /DNA_START= /DNA_END= /DNA_ORIENTATION=
MTACSLIPSSASDAIFSAREAKAVALTASDLRIFAT